MRYDLAQICSTAPTLPRPLQACLAHLQATEVYPLRRGSTTELRRSRPFSPQPRTPPIETRPSSATKAGFNFRSRMHMRVARIRYGKSRWLRTPSVEAGEPEGGWLWMALPSATFSESTPAQRYDYSSGRTRTRLLAQNAQNGERSHRAQARAARLPTLMSGSLSSVD